MKTFSTLALAMLALASLSADHTTDAVGIHSHLTPHQLVSMKQRIAESRAKSLHAKVQAPINKPFAPSMAKVVVAKKQAKALGFDEGLGMHLMFGGDDSNSGSDDGSDVDDSSHVDDASDSGDGNGAYYSHHGIDSNSGSGEHESFELSSFYEVDSNSDSDSGSGESSNDGSGLDGSVPNAPSGYDGSLDSTLGLGPNTPEPTVEMPFGDTQGFDDDDEGSGEDNGDGNPDGVISLHKKDSPVAKKHQKHAAKKEVANHDAKTHDKKHDVKKDANGHHDAVSKKNAAKKAAAKKHDGKKKDAAHEKLSGDKKADLRKGKPATVDQKYAGNALEEQTQQAGEAIAARLSADSSPFDVKGSQMLVMVGSIAGAVVGALGVLMAVVHMRRQRGDAGTGQHALALVSELADPESGRPAEATVDALTSSGIELDDDEFSDSDDNDVQQEEEGAFANAAQVV